MHRSNKRLVKTSRDGGLCAMERDSRFVTLENRRAIVRVEILETSLLVNSLHALLGGRVKMVQEANLAMDSPKAETRFDVSVLDSRGRSASKAAAI